MGEKNYLTSSTEWHGIECVCPVGAYRQQDKTVVFRLIGPSVRTVYEIPPTLSRPFISYEVQSGAVATTVLLETHRYLITWLSEKGHHKAEVRVPGPSTITTYIYQGSVIVDAPEGTRVENSTGEIIVASSKEIRFLSHTMVFPNGLAARLSEHPAVIDLNNWKVLFLSRYPFVKAYSYWQNDGVYVSLANECYRVTPQETCRVGQFKTAYYVFPAPLWIDGAKREMFVFYSMAVVGNRVFLLPTDSAPGFFVAEQGVYFDCGEMLSRPYAKKMAFYSFADATVTDIVLFYKDGAVKVFSPRRAWEWEQVVQNPSEFAGDKEREKIPEEIREELLPEFDRLHLLVQYFGQAISCYYGR